MFQDMHDKLIFDISGYHDKLIFDISGYHDKLYLIFQDMHEKEKEILETEANSKIDNRLAALEKYKKVK